MKATNTYKKIRDDWYSWTVFIEGTAQELNEIKQVVYHLHESFPTSRMVSTNALSNFARTNQGWGEFQVCVEAEMKSGGMKNAEMWLDLGFRHTKESKKKYPGDFL